MSDYHRPFVPGATWLFTVVTHKRRPFLCDDDSRAALRDAVAVVREMLPFRIEGWVLLPDHLHCIWTLPTDDAEIGKRWGQIKTLVTKRISPTSNHRETSRSRAHRREGIIWQRRFWEHLIRDERDLRRHLDYLHFNPVKHGYVATAGEWPWSSLHRHIRLGTYPQGWSGVGMASSGNFGE